MTGGTINSNTAATYGGGIYMNSGTLSISGTSSSALSKIDDNTASGTSYGGGLYIKAGTFTLGAYTSIYNNTAAYGGGIYSSVAFSISNSTTKIYSNTANRNGGGIYKAGSGTLTISAGYIYSNKTTLTDATYGYGGGIYSQTAVSMSGGFIHSNQAIYGGGVYMANYAVTFTMSGGYLGRESSNSTTTCN